MTNFKWFHTIYIYIESEEMHRFKVAIFFAITTLPKFVDAFGCSCHFLSPIGSKSRIFQLNHYQDVTHSIRFLPSSVKMQFKSNKSSSEGENRSRGYASSLSTMGVIAQPIVWASLYCVATTGAGLPSGPFGLIGAVEGISYLVIVALIGNALYRNMWGKDHGDRAIYLDIVERSSYVTIVVGLLVLATLVLQQGCVPNAKPIFDYSDYVPICETTPGLFGI
jgi:hypothetical protein